MKNSFIALTLLLFELNSSYGYSIRKPYKKGHTNAEPRSDVYEVHNDEGSVTFVNPRLDEKKMREMVYYHVVEKPCGEDKAETERPFTNAHIAHGYPSLEEFVHVHKDSNEAVTTIGWDPQPMLADDAIPELSDKVERRKRDVTDQVIPEAPAIPAIRYESFPAYLRELISTEQPEIVDLSGLDLHKDDMKTSKKDSKQPIIKPKIDVRVAKNYIKLENVEKTTPQSVKYYREDVINNTDKRDRKMAKARETITARLERILENLEQRRNINTEQERDKNTEEEKDKNTEEEKDKNIKDEKEDTTVSPNKAFSEFQEMPKTYGMRLLNRQGYVWNDIFTNPGLSYEIGDPENLTDPIAPESENASTQTIETNDEIDKINENINTDMDDIFVHIAKFKQTTPAPDVKEDLARDKDTYKLIKELLQSYIKKTVKSEVKKELEAYISSIEKEHEKPVKPNNDNIGEKDKEVYLENTSLEPHRDTDLENLTKHELIIKKDSFFIDGIEIPFISNYKDNDFDKEETFKRRKVNKKKPAEITTETTNLDSKPSADTNENLNVKNHTGLINVEHVYGNNVGNEKVTNVYVFYPNEELDKVLEELKPIAGENGVMLIKPEKNEDKKEEQTDLETEKEESADSDTGKEESAGSDTGKGESAGSDTEKEELTGSETGKGEEKEKEESINPEMTDAANADQIDQKTEENVPEKEETKPGTDEIIEKEDPKKKEDNIELDVRRFR